MLEPTQSPDLQAKVADNIKLETLPWVGDLEQDLSFQNLQEVSGGVSSTKNCNSNMFNIILFPIRLIYLTLIATIFRVRAIGLTTIYATLIVVAFIAFFYGFWVYDVYCYSKNKNNPNISDSDKKRDLVIVIIGFFTVGITDTLWNIFGMIIKAIKGKPIGC